jgi:hypothetical protein
MSNYYNMKKCSEIPKVRGQMNENRTNGSSLSNRNGNKLMMDSFIDEDNTIYEIDQECYEKLKNLRLTQRQNFDGK